MGFKEFCNGFKKRLEENKEKLRKNKIDINSDDSLIEKGFCAFLQDLLNELSFNKNKSKELLDELKKNEKLGKEKFLTICMNSLKDNEKLTNEVIEQINNNLSNKYVQDLAFKIISNKLNKQAEQGQESEEYMEISAKDAVKAGADIMKNPTPINVVKTLTQKIAHRMVK